MTTPTTETAPNLAPEGWQDWSAYRFLAPERKQMVGRLLTAQLPGIRGQLTITWEPVENKTLAQLMLERPLPFGVMHVGTTEDAGKVRRVFRFQDPLKGWLIQQSQTFILADGRLYTMTLSADPMHFAACEADMKNSRRTLQLIRESLDAPHV